MNEELRRQGRAKSSVCDVLIVGAGPAGLFSALEISKRTDLRILVIDAGQDVESRSRSRMLMTHNDDLVSGVGGAGLYSDGKLCLSLSVGGDLSATVDSGMREELIDQIASSLGVPYTSPRTSQLHPRRMADSSLSYTDYPVIHLGSDHCKERIVRLRDELQRSGVRILANTQLTGLDKACDQHFIAAVFTGMQSWSIQASRVVLALGKVGADLERRLCIRLGAHSDRRRMYVGVRLETDANTCADLFMGSPDPKYKLHFDDGSKVKTHCVVNNGEVLPLFYNGWPVAGGHAYSDQLSGRTSFGVLWDGVNYGKNAYSFALRLMKHSAEQANGKLLVQRLVDYQEGKTSKTDDVMHAHPSTKIWSAGDLRAVMPPAFFPPFNEFIAALERLGQPFDAGATLLFGPAIEWWMERIQTDQDLAIPEVSGLYVAGDGSGWSQGIVHAAATGLVVGKAIRRTYREAP